MHVIVSLLCYMFQMQPDGSETIATYCSPVVKNIHPNLGFLLVPFISLNSVHCLNGDVYVCIIDPCEKAP